MPYIEVSCVEGKRQRRRRPLLDCVSVRFEDARPVRPFRWPPGGRHFPGWYWAVTTGQHVGFESWLERDRLVLMDFDPAVVGIASQPFWLHWHDGTRERRHAPDFFVRRADGSAAVVDVRADDWIGPRDAAAFEVTRRACRKAGWGFERVGVPEPVLLANVRWLSRSNVGITYCGGMPSAAVLGLIAELAAAGDAIVIAPDADLGGIRIAIAVYQALSPAGQTRSVFCDVGSAGHVRQRPWAPDSPVWEELRTAQAGPAAALAQDCLDRGYPVEQEAAIIESVLGLI
ncbi:TnsA-like heteromeric transposase endonuclease subunit [Streptomyces sp. NPDC058301]|uniref:TnsA-like heteromeric transposase endonuclease subunit n=1 Tax=Streptomyces sp. NPDC058301 TaxID=3346436 RepID=UPI0036E15FEF